jgi:hypothetical protein
MALSQREAMVMIIGSIKGLEEVSVHLVGPFCYFKD